MGGLKAIAMPYKLICPGCGDDMFPRADVVSNDELLVACENPDCKYYEVQFKPKYPKIELHRVVDGPVTYAEQEG